MTATILENVNFKILLQQHGGNFARAKEAWDKILAIGGFGNVPHTYEGGLDVRGLHVLLDERKQGQATAIAYSPRYAVRGSQVIPDHQEVPQAADDLEEKIHKIEDIAAGDDPSKVSI